MDECNEVSENDIYEIFDITRVPSLMNLDDETTDDEQELFSMTSLNSIMLLGQSIELSERTSPQDDGQQHLKRLSLAYERLHLMPKVIVQELGPTVQILDISNNMFENLNFLEEFTELTSLVCDHNNITSKTVFPLMPKLELLWLNHCKITELYPWAKRLQQSCPNLRYLSLMGNPAAPSYLNGGNFYEYLQYRLFIISLFPKLIHLDDRKVTPDQREEAKRMYHRPIIERIVSKTSNSLPFYLRTASDKFSGLMTSTGSLTKLEKNCII